MTAESEQAAFTPPPLTHLTRHLGKKKDKTVKKNKIFFDTVPCLFIVAYHCRRRFVFVVLTLCCLLFDKLLDFFF